LLLTTFDMTYSLSWRGQLLVTMIIQVWDELLGETPLLVECCDWLTFGWNCLWSDEVHFVGDNYSSLILTFGMKYLCYFKVWINLHPAKTALDLTRSVLLVTMIIQVWDELLGETPLLVEYIRLKLPLIWWDLFCGASLI
jgi:hypothetical protein